VKGDGRGWWRLPGHEHARCKAQRKDPYFPGRCSNKARVGGFCRVHAKIKKLPLSDTAGDVEARLRDEEFRRKVRHYVAPTEGNVAAVLDATLLVLKRERKGVT